MYGKTAYRARASFDRHRHFDLLMVSLAKSGHLDKKTSNVIMYVMTQTFKVPSSSYIGYLSGDKARNDSLRSDGALCTR